MDINRGDIFLLGNHRLMNGDSLSLIDVNKLLDGQKADIIFTDPPYCINYQRENHSWKHRYITKIQDFKDKDFDIVQLLDLINTGIVKGAVYLCCGQGQIGEIHKWCQKTLKIDPRMIIWVKNNMSISRSDFHRRYETIMYFWYNEKKKRAESSDYIQDVWFIKNRRVDKYLHPTQKPIALIQKAIEINSDKEDIVLDLFLGSGSTLIACENTDRRCYGMEIDPDYCKIIIDRFEAFTGLKAIKLNELIKPGI